MALKNKNEISVGARAEGGSSVEFNTGSWRALRPNIELNKCIHCMLCFLYCPDNAVKIIKFSDKQGGNPEVIGIDIKHCKGCSICSSVCPVKCITMDKETDALKRDAEGNK
jgi:2-oxoacid:acceptor oxidoreductase delta subunit (pyruvate/2-ketoisovalerate family)